MTSFKFGSLLASLVFSVAASLPAAAHENVYNGVLSGLSENPVNASAGTGNVTVTIDFDLLTMEVQASFSGLSGTTSAAHIHCCELPPTNAGVATQTPSFSGFPLGVTSGTYDHTFDMALASSYNAAFITANGGTVSTAFSALVAGMDAGKSYFNVHTSFAPGGEVRAQLALAPVPEPESYAMLAAGLGLLTFVMRRRRS